MHKNQMLASISPMSAMTASNMNSTELYSYDTSDTVIIHQDSNRDSNDSLDANDDVPNSTKLATTSSAVEELIINAPEPAPIAYELKSLSLPETPDDIQMQTSFDAVYDPTYRHEVVPFFKV
eukprot:TRINITY_DN15025_c0_g1_i1.p1 TRINITY_DN15025_c0_g1~~TRINITY_DN15025_c0_g1_i1.p1  ORF type:complete len:122 (+),score=10.21 TRINITY_DN15025_c0_g1_i1:236-601(+)